MSLGWREAVSGRLSTRAAAIVEILLVLALTIGHRVLRVIPVDETLPIFLLGWLCLWLRKTGWRGVGLSRPVSWRLAWLFGLVFVTGLFGFGHSYQGLAGVLDTGIHGLIFGVVYLASGRNLWASIIAHGVCDTVGIVMIFFGWFQHESPRRDPGVTMSDVTFEVVDTRHAECIGVLGRDGRILDGADRRIGTIADPTTAWARIPPTRLEGRGFSLQRVELERWG